MGRMGRKGRKGRMGRRGRRGRIWWSNGRAVFCLDSWLTTG